MIPITLPKFAFISEDEKHIVIQEAMKQNSEVYYRTYMLEKDRLYTKELFKHLSTDVLNMMRQNITYELRNRKRKNKLDNEVSSDE